MGDRRSCTRNEGSADHLERDTPYLSVVIPAYNEQQRLERTLNRILEYLQQQEYTYEVVVVSDGSTDCTETIVEQWSAQHPCLKLLAYHPNRGKGYAVRYGMLRARGEYLLFSDADLATPIEEVEKLFPQVKDNRTIAIGSRPLKESQLMVRQPFYREWLGRGFNKVVQLLAVWGVQDTQCGFKLFPREVAHQVFALCRLNGFSFDFEVLYFARRMGYRIVEVPVRWSHQPGSKVRLLRDGFRMLRDLIWLRLTAWNRRLEPSTQKEAAISR